MLNAKIEKLSLDIFGCNDAALIQIAEICGRSLRYFRLHTDNPVPAATCAQFFQGCPRLRYLDIMLSRSINDPNLITLAEIGAILPPALETFIWPWQHSSISAAMRDFCEARIYLNSQNSRWRFGTFRKPALFFIRIFKFQK